MLTSGMCRQAQLESPAFQDWGRVLGERPRHMHRKVWEFCFITEALFEREMLRTGRRGLGFAVGQEPLASLYASRGCTIVATDLQTDAAMEHGWVETGQHAANLADLNVRGLCPPDEFARRAAFRFVDMREIPADLRGFDFTWSACALEHLGSLAAGEQFIFDALECLKPGGIAIHTTEFNLSSNEDTIGAGSDEQVWQWPTVLYRQQDIQRIAQRLRMAGHTVDLDFTRGDGPADLYMDPPPYSHGVHLRLEIGGYLATSYGLIIQKAAGCALT